MAFPRYIEDSHETNSISHQLSLLWPCQGVGPDPNLPDGEHPTHGEELHSICGENQGYGDGIAWPTYQLWCHQLVHISTCRQSPWGDWGMTVGRWLPEWTNQYPHTPTGGAHWTLSVDYILSVSGQPLRASDGAAMGSPFSSVVANLYIKHLEEITLQTAYLTPRPRLKTWTALSLSGHIDRMSWNASMNISTHNTTTSGSPLHMRRTS